MLAPDVAKKQVWLLRCPRGFGAALLWRSEL